MSEDLFANRRPTIADVAAAAQVSVATVNRVLSGKQPVRKATARQVVEAAETLGFMRPELCVSARKPNRHDEPSARCSSRVARCTKCSATN